MAWSAPMTAVANAAFTAAQFNTYVRDNLNETAPAKATTAGSIFVGTGANAIAERIPTSAVVSTSEGTTSGAFTDLTTGGPAVTVTTGTKAIVIVTAQISSSAASDGGLMGYDISGATTQVATSAKAMRLEAAATTNFLRCTTVISEPALTAGSNTFTSKYRRITTGTASFANREILVIPL